MSTTPTAADLSMGLYLHFPFCAYKCGYCDFNSWVETGSEPQRQWLEGIKNEILFWKSHNNGALGAFQFNTLFMGGGTPSLLRAELWSELSSFLKSELRFSDDLEWTVECNPETINEELLALFSDLGVNRLSLGIQSFKEKYLKRLERGASPQANRRALEIINKKWHARWSLDLMFGLPEQSLEEWEGDLRQALAFSPKHLSAYQLTLTTQKSKSWKQGSDSELLDFFRKTREFLSQYGLEAYEVSNFASPGCESRHNLKYWKAESFLGLGPGAYSLLPQEFFEDAPLGAHFKTPSRMDEWLRATQNPNLEKAEKRSEREHVTELLMLGLRLQKGIEKSRFPRGLSWQKLEPYADLVEQNSSMIKATSRGLEILDTTLVMITNALFPESL